jgi:hypothetical protein
MERWIQTGRSFELTPVESTQAKAPSPPQPNEARILPNAFSRWAPAGVTGTTPRLGHDRLVTVGVVHDYYNRFENRCFDFEVQPTPATMTLLRSVGMLFRREGTGFSVLYDTARTTGLERYLRADANAGEGKPGEIWTRLSFVLVAKNPLFVNVTEIPFNTRSIDENFYLTNQAAHHSPGGPPDEVLLGARETISAKELLPVFPTRFRVSGVPTVVRDISGAVIAQVPSGSGPPYFIDLSLVREGKYTLEQPGGDPSEFVYTSAAPTPLCFIDLLLTSPNGRKKGVYPVHLTQSGFQVNPVSYTLKFKARSARWTYYIVPQSPKVRFCDLRIEGANGSHAPAFEGPTEVKLPSGADAYRFVSEKKLLLQQTSSYDLRLRGRRHGMAAEERVLVDRLPVASPTELRPPDPNHPREPISSDIYVYV